MAIKGKTILLGPAYCKQAERKVERVRDAVWRGAEKEKSSEESRRGRVGRPEFHILFSLQVTTLFEWLLRLNFYIIQCSSKNVLFLTMH